MILGNWSNLPVKDFAVHLFDYGDGFTFQLRQYVSDVVVRADRERALGPNFALVHAWAERKEGEANVRLAIDKLPN